MRIGRTVRMVNAASASTAAPSLSTDGVSVPSHVKRDSAIMLVQSSAASGTRSFRVAVWIYVGEKTTAFADAAAIASSDAWIKAYDTGTYSNASDFTEAFEIPLAISASRVYVQVVSTPGGTTPSLTVSLAPIEG